MSAGEFLRYLAGDWPNELEVRAALGLPWGPLLEEHQLSVDYVLQTWRY